MCVYIVYMHAVEDSLNSQSLSKDQEKASRKKEKNKEKKQQKQLQHHSSSALIQKQTLDTTGTSNWTGFYGQLKLKKEG